MVRLSFLFAITIFLASFVPVQAADDLTGRQIMDEASERHDTPNEFSTQEMILIDRKGNERSRAVRRFQLEVEDGLKRLLMVFDTPKGVKGVAMLTWEKKDAEDDQWTYLPALKRLKRIVGGGKRNYFMGTDFANEDFDVEDRDSFKYERLEDATYDGKEVYVVDAFPVGKDAKKNTGYERRRIYIGKDNFFQYKTDFYERRTGKHLKTMTVEEVATLDGGIMRAKRALMDNFKNKHKTRVVTKSWDFSKKAVSPKIFKHRYIERKKHMR